MQHQPGALATHTPASNARAGALLRRLRCWAAQRQPGCTASTCGRASSLCVRTARLTAPPQQVSPLQPYKLTVVQVQASKQTQQLASRCARQAAQGHKPAGCAAGDPGIALEATGPGLDAAEESNLALQASMPSLRRASETMAQSEQRAVEPLPTSGSEAAGALVAADNGAADNG